MVIAAVNKNGLEVELLWKLSAHGKLTGISVDTQNATILKVWFRFILMIYPRNILGSYMFHGTPFFLNTSFPLEARTLRGAGA